MEQGASLQLTAVSSQHRAMILYTGYLFPASCWQLINWSDPRMLSAVRCLLLAEFPLTLQPLVCYLAKLTLVPVYKRLADAPESFMALGVVEFQG